MKRLLAEAGREEEGVPEAVLSQLENLPEEIIAELEQYLTPQEQRNVHGASTTLARILTIHAMAQWRTRLALLRASVHAWDGNGPLPNLAQLARPFSMPFSDGWYRRHASPAEQSLWLLKDPGIAVRRHDEQWRFCTEDDTLVADAPALTTEELIVHLLITLTPDGPQLVHDAPYMRISDFAYFFVVPVLVEKWGIHAGDAIVFAYAGFASAHRLYAMMHVWLGEWAPYTEPHGTTIAAVLEETRPSSYPIPEADFPRVYERVLQAARAKQTRQPSK